MEFPRFSRRKYGRVEGIFHALEPAFFPPSALGSAVRGLPASLLALRALWLLDPSTSPARLLRGAAAGLLGGLLFGAMMASAGMMEMVAMLVGSTSVGVGWTLHLLISAAFGALFGFGVHPGAASRSVALGAGYGLALWAIAAMIIMRLWLGAQIQLDAMAVRSLAGHVAFGAVLGVAYPLLPVGEWWKLRPKRIAPSPRSPG